MSRIQLKTFSSLFIFLVADVALDSRLITSLDSFLAVLQYSNKGLLHEDAKANKSASTQASHFHLLKCKRALSLCLLFTRTDREKTSANAGLK